MAAAKMNTSANAMRYTHQKIKGVFEKKYHPKTVAIIGWLGAFNLGDEMMLNVSMHKLIRRGDKLTILTYKKDAAVEKRYEGFKVISRRPLTRQDVREVVETNDSLLVNGGALIDDRYYTSTGSLARDIAKLAHSFIAAGKPVVVYGISANTNLKNKQLINDYKRVVEGAAHFSMRDDFSRDEMNRHFDASKIEIVDDIVFADETLIQKPVILPGRTIISVIAVLDKNTIDHVKRFFDYLTSATEASIKFISFYDENYNDAKYIEEIKNYLGDRRMRIDEISSPINSADLFNALLPSDIVFSMRYHGSLVANAMGKKVITIDYDKHPHYFNKNKYLQDHYGFSTASFKLTDIESMSIDDIRRFIDHTAPTEVDIKSINSRARADLIKALNLL